MIRLIINNLLKRRERASLVAVSAALIAAAFALFSSASAATTVTADQALSQYWRTTYDILVRSPDAVTEIEREHGLVEANHLSGNPGGITFEQYELIKDFEEVEVAAPIAILGYVPRNPIRVGIRDFFPTGIYRITVSSHIDTGNSIQEYTLSEPYYGLYTQGFDPARFPSENPIQKLQELTISLGLRSAGDADFFGFSIPTPHFDDRALLAAIDPEQEAALINLDDMIIEDHYLASESETLLDTYGYPQIPILLNVHDYVTQDISIQIEQVKVGDFPIRAVEGERYEGYYDATLLERLMEIEGFEVIESAPRQTIWERTIPIGREWRKSGLAIQLLGDEFLRPYDWIRGISGQILVPDSIEYRILKDPSASFPDYVLVLEAVPLGQTTIEEKEDVLEEFGSDELINFLGITNWRRDPEVIFRNLTPRISEQLNINTIVQGVFEINPLVALGDRSPNQVPLETYLPPLVTLKYDAEGNPIAGELTLRPTLNYKGYLVSPPDILMSLDSARDLFEHACFIYVEAPPPLYWDLQKSDCSTSGEDIISAIRIRVAEIDELTPEAQVRIEQIAEEIVEKTGLHVDIMVGSSPEPVLVHIPGYEDVPALGYVEELWVKKGVSTLVSVGINRADSLLFSLMLLVSMLFLFNANYVSVLGRMPEFGVMMALGWRRRTLFSMILGEGLFLGLLSSSFGALAAYGIVQVLGLPIQTQRILWLIPLGSLLFLLGSLLPAWRASRAQPKNVIGAGETQATEWSPQSSSLLNYAVGGALRRPGRTLVTVLGLAMSSAFLVLLKLILDGLDGALYGTLLGAWVRTQVQPFHFMMAAVALLAAALGAAVLMLLNIMQRRNEIGLLVALGWRRSDLLRLFLLESALIALFSGLIGTFGGIGVFYLSYPIEPLSLASWLQILGLGILLPLVVVEIATLYPANRGARLLPLDAFRGEERLTESLGLARAVSWVGLLGALGLVLTIGIFWARGGLPEPPSIPLAEIAPSPTAQEFAPANEAQATPTPVVVESLSSYNMELEIDPEAMQLRGQAEVNYVNDTGKNLNSIVLRLYPNYPERLADGELQLAENLLVEALFVAGQPPAFSVSAEEAALTISLKEPLNPGDSLDFSISFTYQIPPSFGNEGDLLQLYSFFPVLAQHDESGWRTDVCDDCLNDFYAPMVNYTYAFSVPEKWEVLATGEQLSATPVEDGRLRYVYEAGPVRDLAIALGQDLFFETLSIDELTLNVYGLKNKEQDVQIISQIAGQILRYYQDHLGPYAYPTLNLLLLPNSFTSGLDYPQLSFVVYKTIDNELEQVLGRYIAYQWWAQVVGNDFYNEAWLSEALADYSAIGYLTDELGAEVSNEVLREYQTEYSVLELENQREYSVGESVWSINEAGQLQYLDIVRKKGALFLDKLRQAIGDEAFFGGLQSYYGQYQFGVGDSEAFLDVLSQAAGLDLRPLFDEWGVLVE